MSAERFTYTPKPETGNVYLVALDGVEIGEVQSEIRDWRSRARSGWRWRNMKIGAWGDCSSRELAALALAEIHAQNPGAT